MEFTKAELEAIKGMCKHERTIFDIVETVVPGVKVSQAHANVAAMSAKADAMIADIEKAEAIAAKAATEKAKEA